jgi:hypothetical protein
MKFGRSAFVITQGQRQGALRHKLLARLSVRFHAMLLRRGFTRGSVLSA